LARHVFEWGWQSNLDKALILLPFRLIDDQFLGVRGSAGYVGFQLRLICLQTSDWRDYPFAHKQSLNRISGQLIFCVVRPIPLFLDLDVPKISAIFKELTFIAPYAACLHFFLLI
jgi:hypothetical protein